MMKRAQSSLGVSLEFIEVRINGEKQRIPAQLAVPEFLRQIGVAPERVAIELNRAIVRRREWDATIVPAGAEIEVVEFVGGG